MNAVTQDLHHYHLARLLHLVPHLHRVYVENCFLLPLFFACVSPAAKRHARFVLLCLQRRFGSHCASDVCIHILSFLSFPEFAAPPPSPPIRPVRGQQLLVPGAKKRARDEADGGESAGHLRPQLANAAAVAEGRVVEEKEEHHGSVSRLMTDTEEGGKQVATDLMFYVRPPVAATTKVAATSAKTTPNLFVRMVSEYPLNEETMNTYFGRYGQVSCTLLRQQLLSVDEHTEGSSVLQDFIVTVDSTHNALQAVRHAYYRELVFIALHDPAHNLYTIDDVDRMLHDVAVEVVERSACHGTVSEAEREESAAALLLHSFVPDVVVDGLPYWLTVDQLRASFSEYGRVEDVRIAVDDRSGAFTGTALLRMSSVMEAVAASEGLNGAVLKDHPLVSGVLDDRLNIVSLRHGTIIRPADEVVPEYCDLTENHRRWV